MTKKIFFVFLSVMLLVNGTTVFAEENSFEGENETSDSGERNSEELSDSISSDDHAEEYENEDEGYSTERIIEESSESDDLFLSEEENESGDITNPDEAKVEIISSLDMYFSSSKDPSKKIEVSITPQDLDNQELIWQSTHPEVATVIDGIVTPVGAGFTDIKVSLSNGSTATCTVWVCGIRRLGDRFQKISDNWIYYLKEQFVEYEGDFYYVDAYGVIIRNSWQQVNHDLLYFADDGKAISEGGAYTIDKKRFLFQKKYEGYPAKKVTGWISLDGKWYYGGPEGTDVGFESGICKIQTKYYCFNDDGLMLTGWQVINGRSYFFSKIGSMVTGFQTIDGKIYYFYNSQKPEECHMAEYNGWKKIDSKWYYFGSGHFVKTGWLNTGGKWYWLDKSGVMATGWKDINGKKYYLNNDGTMATGWKYIDNMWYWFESSGTLIYDGWKKISNKWYWFNSFGAMVTGWRKISNKWYWFDSSGAMVTGWKKISGKWYWFNSSGAMVTGWKKISGKWYWFNSSGAMVTGWKKISGKWYWFDSSGAMITGSRVLGGKTYRFDSSGACLNP